MSYLYPKRNSLPLLQIVLLGLLGIAAGLAASLLYFSPRVVAAAPAENGRTGSFAAIEIQFSVPMGADCTADHFSIVPEIAGDLVIEGGTLRFTPRDPWPAGSSVRVSILAGACSEKGLPLLAGRSWSFAASRARVAYIPSLGPGNRLMGIAAEGGAPEILAEVSSPLQNFDLSRRGDFGVLSTGAGSLPDKLWLTRLDGLPAQLLLDCGADACSDPAISPDGLHIAYIRRSTGADPDPSAAPAQPFIELLTIASGRTRTISIPGNTAGNPSWSAQGWLSYYDGTRQVIIIDDLAGGQTAVPNQSGAAWAWLPDGSAIIFPELFVDLVGETEGTSSNVYSLLFQVEVETNRRTNLSGIGQSEDASPAVSPDASMLAFSRNFFDNRWTPGRQLWIMDLENGSARQISQAPDYSHTSIHWSPDGAQLLFMTFHETVPGDPPEIWCVATDGSDPRRLVTGGYLPKWLP